MSTQHPPISFKEQMDAIDRRAAEVASKIGMGEGQSMPRPVTIQTDPKIGEMIAQLREQGGSIPLNADGSIKEAPTDVDSAMNVAPAVQAPPLPTVSVTQQESPKTRQLSDSEIINLVKPFLDSSVLRPIFISKPIMKRVYVGVYPSYVEMLAAERMLGPVKKTLSGEVDSEYLFLSELGACIRGWVFEHDPKLLNIQLHPGDVSKWPPLHSADFLSALHPSTRHHVIPELAADYLEWKVAVTPTNDELEKYYGLMK